MSNSFDCYICKNILIDPYFCSKCKIKFCINCLDIFNYENGYKCPNKKCGVYENFNCFHDDNLENELLKKNNLKCNKCNVIFKNYESYKNHKCYKCSFCENKFTNDENLFNHLKEKHAEIIIEQNRIK